MPAKKKIFFRRGSFVHIEGEFLQLRWVEWHTKAQLRLEICVLDPSSSWAKSLSESEGYVDKPSRA